MSQKILGINPPSCDSFVSLLNKNNDGTVNAPENQSDAGLCHLPGLAAIGICSMLVLAACGAETRIETETESAGDANPNIVIFYIDDLGYGDVGSYGASGVETPNIDSLAARGVRFTDAHSSAATCTPSRYSLLLGEHGFRIEADILEGDAPLLIRPGRPTIASMLKRAGYATGVVGKWHLGLGNGDLDWNGDISPGPLDIGFDYAFLLPATGDRVPAVYVENRAVVNLEPSDPMAISYSGKVGERPTGYENPELLRFAADPQHSDTIINGVSRIGHMGGGESALWVDEEFPDVFTDKAVQFIRAHKDERFFLFHSFHDIHVPRLPHPRFAGASTMGPRGDAIAQVDWMIGEIIAELESLGIAGNTLLIFTSDNGPVLDDGYADQSVTLLGQHRPAGPFRGGKYSAYEAGTRVPTIVTWPDSVEASVSDALVSQLDLYASLAALVGQNIANREAIDSRDQLDAWLGRSNTGREFLLEESVGTLSLRRNDWKYILPFDGRSGLEWVAEDKDIEGGFVMTPQLYNLDSDIGEQANLAGQYPDLVEELDAEARRIFADTYQ
ncbi:MAG: arylsulfatase [Gammaproteobacteria bacterium]|nr:arylsulfatase [Gammaproteobacteria bacterium]